MEINIKTSGFGLGDYSMNASFSTETGGTLSVTASEPDENTASALEQIQEHLNAMKEVFFSPDYDDKTMGFVVEDYIIAIQEILDAN
jgi:hypothetical protein